MAKRYYMLDQVFIVDMIKKDIIRYKMFREPELTISFIADGYLNQISAVIKETANIINSKEVDNLFAPYIKLAKEPDFYEYDKVQRWISDIHSKLDRMKKIQDKDALNNLQRLKSEFETAYPALKWSVRCNNKKLPEPVKAHTLYFNNKDRVRQKPFISLLEYPATGKYGLQIYYYPMEKVKDKRRMKMKITPTHNLIGTTPISLSVIREHIQDMDTEFLFVNAYNSFI